MLSEELSNLADMFAKRAERLLSEILHALANDARALEAGTAWHGALPPNVVMLSEWRERQ